MNTNWSKKIFADRNHEIVELVRSGVMPIHQVANKFGITPSRISQIMRQLEPSSQNRNDQLDAKLKQIKSAIRWALDAIDTMTQATPTPQYHRHSDPVVLDTDMLRHEYLDKGLSTTQLAKRHHCSAQTISNRLRSIGTPMRPSIVGTSRLQRRSGIKLSFDPMTLRHEYLNLGKSTTELAKKYHCSSSAIGSHLRRIGVQLRPSPIPNGKKAIHHSIDEHNFPIPII